MYFFVGYADRKEPNYRIYYFVNIGLHTVRDIKVKLILISSKINHTSFANGLIYVLFMDDSDLRSLFGGLSRIFTGSIHATIILILEQIIIY